MPADRQQASLTRRPARAPAAAIRPQNQAWLWAAAAARRPGAPLPLDVQYEAARRYGHSFSHVRIHADGQAATAAASLHAAAFTIGSDIVFGANRYAPASAPGRLLLQHELRHVEQQRTAAPAAAPELDPPHSAHERTARLLLDPRIDRLQEQRIQCAPEDEQFSLGGGLVDRVGASVFGGTAWPFIKSVLEGFIGGLLADVKSGRADQAKEHLSKLLVPWNAAKFSAGYLVGLVLGLISPITDLVKGIVGIVRLAIGALEWLAKWSPVGVAMSPERQQKIARLTERFAELSTELGKALSDFIADPSGTVKKFAGFLDNLMQLALGKAREIGAKAADAIFAFLERDYYDMGQGIGEAIGTLIAQVLLLVFSDAIGNLISKGASFLGKAAEFAAGKAVEVFEWVKGLVSEVVGLLRNAVKGALKLFEGLVNKAIEAFDALAALFTESEALGAGAETVAAGVGRDVAGPLPNVMESRMVSGTRTAPATVADLRPPKVHPSKVGGLPEQGTGRGAAMPKGLRGPKSATEAAEELERTGGAAHPGEAAAIGSEIEQSIEVQDWAAELAGEGYETYPRNRFGEGRIGGRRLSSMFTDARARPDMIAVNETEKTIIVGDVTANPATRAAVPGQIGQEEGLHIEKTIEYAKQLKRQLPPDSNYRVFAQDRHWQTGTRTKLIEIP